MRLSLKATVAGLVAGLAVVAGCVTPAAQAAPAQQPPTGWKMLVHQMSHTYLFPHGYVDAENAAVQTWNVETLVPDQGYKWQILPDYDGANTYHIRSYPNVRCLTSGATAGDYVRVKPCGVSDSQRWYLRLVPGTTDDWAIVPYTYPDYALAPIGPISNNVWVVPKLMWGGEPDLTQAWRGVNPPSGR
jgi:hypothetical protein